jgi:uroporphyrinogen decarboxylase
MFQPSPDFNRLLKVFLRQGEPDRLPFIELFADHEMMEAVLGEPIPRPEPSNRPLFRQYIEQVQNFYLKTGYDYVFTNAVLNIPRQQLHSEDTAALKRSRRVWDDENTGPIQTWQDFENFPWPRPEEIDYFRLEYTAKIMPEGMQMIYLGPGGQFENMAELMGLTTLAYKLHDDPALVHAVSEKVGEMLVTMYTNAAQAPGMGALFLGDDMGYKTSTTISPSHLRQYVFPWQKRLAAIAHANGLPFLLHSCGKLERVMDDLIDDVGIDAKHSFEDVILPITEAKQLYGKRIALLGGVDMDYLCRHTPDEVRAYTRQIIEICTPGGGFALGTGNTVANYIPVENYLAMLDEGRLVGW